MGWNLPEKKEIGFLRVIGGSCGMQLFHCSIVVATLSIATLKKHCTYYAIVEKELTQERVGGKR